MNTYSTISTMVHELYYGSDTNCARTMLFVLSKLLDQNIAPQTLQSAVALHGCGGHGDQCGLASGAVMFLGIYFLERGWNEKDVVCLAYTFAENYRNRFGSLLCRDLRPGGFSGEDPPHLCENLTNESIAFTHQFILDNSDK